jgi:hypothetical protein
MKIILEPSVFIVKQGWFQKVGEYDMKEGFFKGNTSYLMVKQI